MKKFIIFFVIGSFLTCNIFATGLGIRGGLLFSAGSNWNSDMDAATSGSDKKIMIGGDIAAYAKVPINKNVFLQPEINLMIHNGLGFTKNSKTTEITYNSVDFPVLAGYQMPVPFGIMNFMGGLNISLPLGKLQYKSDVYDDDSKKIDSNIILGGVLGVAANFKVSGGLIVVDGRYVFDFSDMKAEGTKYYTRRCFVISAGYQYHL